jgi:K+-transporting ATPase c subunit
MTLQQVRQAQAAERAAKDAFWASAGAADSKMTAKQAKLQAAMVAATKARQAAMTAYAATLVG